MVDEKRVDFDAVDGMDVVNKNLLDDVVAATQQAKKRKADDKARDAQLETKGRDRVVMFVIIALAAAVLFAIAYWTMFRGSASETNNLNNTQKQTAPVQPQNYRSAPTVPNYSPNRPVAPPSEPVRRTPTDTYDEGPGTGGM